MFKFVFVFLEIAQLLMIVLANRFQFDGSNAIRLRIAGRSNSPIADVSARLGSSPYGCNRSPRIQFAKSSKNIEFETMVILVVILLLLLLIGFPTDVA